MPATETQPARPFQFRIGTILMVTTLGAAIVAVSRLTGAPLEWQIGISCYFFLLILYFALRVPYLVKTLFGKDSSWERVQQKRRELEEIARGRDDQERRPGD